MSKSHKDSGSSTGAVEGASNQTLLSPMEISIRKKCWVFMVAALVIELHAVEPQHGTINAKINNLLMSYEFHDTERRLLAELPEESVAILIQRLNSIEPAKPTEARLFGFLHAKLEQHLSTLPSETVSAALDALMRKADDPRTPDRDHRKQNIASLQTALTAAGSMQDQDTLSHSKKSPLIPESPEEQATHTTWSVAFVLIIAAICLRWMLLKNEPK